MIRRAIGCSKSTRAFALDRLAANGRLDHANRGHARAMVAVLRARPVNSTPVTRSALLFPDLENLRAAMRWTLGPTGDRLTAVEIGAEFNWLWHVLGAVDEGARHLEAAEPWVDELTPPRIAARFWLSRAKIYSATAKFPGEYALRAADLFRPLGDSMALFDALYTAAAQFGYVSRREEAERALAEAESLVDPGWPLPARAMIEFVRGIVAQWGGDPAAGRRRFAAALEILRGSVAENDAYLELVWTLLIAADLCLRNAREVIVAADEFLSRPRLPTRAFNQAIVGSYRAVARIQVGELDRGEAELRAGLEPCRWRSARPIQRSAMLLIWRRGEIAPPSPPASWARSRPSVRMTPCRSPRASASRVTTPPGLPRRRWAKRATKRSKPSGASSRWKARSGWAWAFEGRRASLCGAADCERLDDPPRSRRSPCPSEPPSIMSRITNMIGRSRSVRR